MQRSLLRAHLRRRYGLPDLLGALLSCMAPLLRHWRSQARVQEAFRVCPHDYSCCMQAFLRRVLQRLSTVSHA